MESGHNAAIAKILVRMRLLENSAAEIVPLAGGVSSDIYRVSAPGKRFVVKRALPKLRVAADWRAPIERNRYEVEWLRAAAEVEPTAVPEILGHDKASGLFAMSYLAPENHPVWKSELRDGRVDRNFAARVGERIGCIHRATAGRADVASRFATDHIFHPIRLEPYLEATARRHPALAEPLMTLSRDTLATKRALVHGDVSPKNILVGPAGPVFLDAECAWYGDPAFDLAFCLNHLLLKALWNRDAAQDLLDAFGALQAAYLAQVGWEPPEAVEARAAWLLAALFLARVDGKSPVEYITDEDERDSVRRTAIPLIKRPSRALRGVRDAWAEELSKMPDKRG
jgi:aminoglycoside phosphotransferase (APT) family kinase protein